MIKYKYNIQYNKATTPLKKDVVIIDEMSMVQKQELVDFAVKQNDIQLDRIKIVSDKCGVDVLKAIELNRQKGE